MARLTIERLTLDHFKGIAHLDLHFDGADATIYGRNGAGKTTIADAWQWLLFGKDTTNRKDFSVKSLDATGSTVPQQVHSVEAVIAIDGQRLTLQRLYTEKWTKKRGQVTAEFSGHTTEYRVDGVPVSAGDFLARLPNVEDEEVFRLVTDPTYLNEQMSWKDRRHWIMRLAPTPDEAAIIASDVTLGQLPPLLQGRSVEDFRKTLEAARKQQAKDLAGIPARIDELTRTLGEAPEGATLETRIADAEAQRSALETERITLQAGGARGQMLARLSEVEALMARRRRDLLAPHEAQRADRARAIQTLDDQIQQIARSQSAQRGEAERLEARITALTAQIEQQRTAWANRNAETFQAPASETVCAACGQELPPEAVEAARQAAEDQFNIRKATDLAQIQTTGKQARADLEALEAAQAEAETQWQTLETERVTLHTQWVALQAELEALEATPVDVNTDAQWQAWQAEEADLAAQLAAPDTDRAVRIAQLGAQIAQVEATLRTYETERQRGIQRAEALQRIDALRTQEKTLTTALEHIEHQLALCDQWTRQAVRLVETAVNAQFPTVRWQLFETQVNGGVADTCTCTVQGVPYPDLNHASKIHAGLEIVRVLSAFSGLVAPIFIDGRESVVSLPPMDAQCISLCVSADDPNLRLTTHAKVAI